MHSLDLEQLYREINITNFGRIFAYLTFVCLQSGSEESIRQNVRRCTDACRNISIPKAKQNNKRFMLITLSLVLIALYVSL